MIKSGPVNGKRNNNRSRNNNNNNNIELRKLLFVTSECNQSRSFFFRFCLLLDWQYRKISKETFFQVSKHIFKIGSNNQELGFSIYIVIKNCQNVLYVISFYHNIVILGVNITRVTRALPDIVDLLYSFYKSKTTFQMSKELNCIRNFPRRIIRSSSWPNFLCENGPIF